MTLFLAGYFVYAYFLGGIDGLPVLPEIYVLTPGTDPDWLAPDQGNEGETERKLKWAFGAESEEAKRPIKLDLRSRRLLLAANEFEIVKEDGRVKLSPFSAALFSDHKGDDTFPEINTVQSEVAYLTLDQPVTNMAELSTRKIVAIELSGNDGVTLINNRRTAKKGDDIEVRITNGPMFYDDRSNKIFTDGFVQLLDLKTQPHPTKITAKGMELKLSEDSNPNRPKNEPPKAKGASGDGVSGVETLLLKSAVDMHLYLDANSGILGGSAGCAAEQTRGRPERVGGEIARHHQDRRALFLRLDQGIGALRHPAAEPRQASGTGVGLAGAQGGRRTEIRSAPGRSSGVAVPQEVGRRPQDDARPTVSRQGNRYRADDIAHR